MYIHPHPHTHTYHITLPATHTQTATFASLAKDCYTTQKTYRMVLSKYISLLRQAHTQDTVREWVLIIN